ncbi:MAG: hypothetical protein H7318_14690 [Oligoflexus sp.]|nr:hypothetical protein [Oligoflexus sp.]
MQNKSHSQSGFSLVSVLIVMGVVLFSILLISQAKFRQQGTQKALKVKQSYTDVNQALVNSVVEHFHAQMTDACLVGGFGGFSNKDLDGRAKYRYATNIAVTSTAPQVHKDAANRCLQPKQPGTPTNRFYFCVKLDPDLTAPSDSILGAKVAFAEFAVELIDLQTQEPIDCTQYTSRKNDKSGPPDFTPRDGSAGMAVTMALYWENASRGSAQSIYSQKALSYIANQN